MEFCVHHYAACKRWRSVHAESLKAFLVGVVFMSKNSEFKKLVHRFLETLLEICRASEVAIVGAGHKVAFQVRVEDYLAVFFARVDVDVGINGVGDVLLFGFVEFCAGFFFDGFNYLANNIFLHLLHLLGIVGSVVIVLCVVRSRVCVKSLGVAEETKNCFFNITFYYLPLHSI